MEKIILVVSVLIITITLLFIYCSLVIAKRK